MGEGQREETASPRVGLGWRQPQTPRPPGEGRWRRREACAPGLQLSYTRRSRGQAWAPAVT